MYVYVLIYATHHVCMYVCVSTFTRENGLTIIRHAVAVVYSIMYVCMYDRVDEQVGGDANKSERQMLMSLLREQVLCMYV